MRAQIARQSRKPVQKSLSRQTGKSDLSLTPKKLKKSGPAKINIHKDTPQRPQDEKNNSDFKVPSRKESN